MYRIAFKYLNMLCVSILLTKINLIKKIARDNRRRGEVEFGGKYERNTDAGTRPAILVEGMTQARVTCLTYELDGI